MTGSVKNVILYSSETGGQLERDAQPRCCLPFSVKRENNGSGGFRKGMMHLRAHLLDKLERKNNNEKRENNN